MTPLYLYDNALLVQDNALAISENCCCDQECPEPCTISTFGLTQAGFGWSVADPPKTLPIEVTFKYEDSSSEGCSGTNSNPQGGLINCCFRLSTPGDVEIHVSGLTERELANYDFGKVTVGGVTAQINGTQERLECEMGFQSSTKVVNLAAGVRVNSVARRLVLPAAYKHLYYNPATETGYELGDRIVLTESNYTNQTAQFINKNPETDAQWTVSEINAGGFGVKSVAADE